MQPKPNRSTIVFAWRGVTARVSITQNHRIAGWTLLDVVVTSPKEAPLPFAVDGHCQLGVEQAQLDGAGGVGPFLSEWADKLSTTTAYAIAVAKWKQGNLFRSP